MFLAFYQPLSQKRLILIMFFNSIFMLMIGVDFFYLLMLVPLSCMGTMCWQVCFRYSFLEVLFFWFLSVLVLSCSCSGCFYFFMWIFCLSASIMMAILLWIAFLWSFEVMLADSCSTYLKDQITNQFQYKRRKNYINSSYTI